MPTKAKNAGARLTQQGRLDTRAMLGRIDAKELWSRAKRATATELGGSRWTPDDRDQIAAEVVARVLAKLADETPPVKIDRRKLRGSTAYQRARHAEHLIRSAPWTNGVARADSPAVGFVRLCRLAKDRRESLEAERRHVEPTAEPVAVQVVGSRGQERDAEGTEEVAAHFIRATGLDPGSKAHRALAWSFARDLPDGRAQRGTLSTAQVARELKMTPNAFKVAVHRGQRALLKLYPEPTDLLAAIIGHRPVVRVDLSAITRTDAAAALAASEPVPLVYDYNPDGQPWPTMPAYVVTARREDDSHAHRTGPDWREGTGPGGERVKRHADKAAAIAALTRHTPGDQRKASRADRATYGGRWGTPEETRTMSRAERRAIARRDLSRAHRDEQVARKGNK